MAIDLKTGSFKPEYAGKMNFYLSAVDDLVKSDQDQPSIGIILCKNEKGNVTEIEYALKGMSQPMGVSQFEIQQAIPDDLIDKLPSMNDFKDL